MTPECHSGCDRKAGTEAGTPMPLGSRASVHRLALKMPCEGFRRAGEQGSASPRGSDGGKLQCVGSWHSQHLGSRGERLGHIHQLQVSLLLRGRAKVQLLSGLRQCGSPGGLKCDPESTSSPANSCACSICIAMTAPPVAPANDQS